jgi:hypothetical protein
MPRILGRSRKAARADLARPRLRALAKHQPSNFHFRFAGDESWMFYSISRKQYGPLLGQHKQYCRTLTLSEKDVITVCPSGTGHSRTDLPPEGKKMDRIDFLQNIIDPLAENTLSDHFHSTYLLIMSGDYVSRVWVNIEHPVAHRDF